MKFKTAVDANGVGSFAWTIQDNGGTANGGVDTLGESLTITVTAVNDAPLRTAGTVSNLSALEDSATTSLGLGDLAYAPGPASAVDEAGQTLTYKVTALPGSSLGSIVLSDGVTPVMANTTYTLAQLQAITFKTPTDANGVGSFSFQVQDNGGTANGGVDTLTESLTI